jgi:hypothetical protein
MVSSQNPDVGAQLASLSAILIKIADAELELSEAELRCAEDFRDAIERYDVLFRVSEEHLAAETRNRVAADRLNAAVEADHAEQLKPSYAKNKFALQAQVAKAKEEKTDAVAHVRKATEALMDCRARYAHFKINRVRHGWTLFGTVLLRVATAEKQFFAELKDVLREFNKVPPQEVPPETAAAIRAAVVEQMAAPPVEANIFTEPPGDK